MTYTERRLLRRAQKFGVVDPTTKAFAVAAEKLVARGLLALVRQGYEVTEAGRAADAREPIDG